MLMINKLFVEMKANNYEITETNLYGIINGSAIEMKKDILPFPFDAQDKEKINNYQEDVQLYAKNITEARAEAMLKILIDFKEEYIDITDSSTLSFGDDYTQLSSYEHTSNSNEYQMLAIHFLARKKLENSMQVLDKAAYLKAKKMFWDDAIDSQIKLESTPEDESGNKQLIQSIL